MPFLFSLSYIIYESDFEDRKSVRLHSNKYQVLPKFCLTESGDMSLTQ